MLARAAIFLTGTLTALPAVVHAQADTVVLRSGLPVVGELLALKRGKLELDTEEMDVVRIDWEDVALVTSGRFFEVLLSTGEQYFGSLSSPDTAVLQVTGVRTASLPFSRVVSMLQLERGFWARTSGFVDLGTNLARANQLRSVLGKGRLDYRGPKWGLEVNAETYWQSQRTTTELGDTTTSTTRNTLSTALSRFLGARWAATGAGQVEQNEELNLDRRFLGELGGSYTFVRNQGLEFGAGAGLAVNSERFTDAEPKTSAEGVVSVTFDAFDIGDLDLFASVSTYSSPQDGGRFRVKFDARVAWEIFSDFTIGLNVIERYDSRPQSETAQNRDYQYAFSVGWSWG